jgi:tricarballylate dehydrogenase
VVAGGGNAGLCAALQAAESGARVLMVERAPEADRGGNSKYTRNIRVAGRAHGGYEPAEFLADLAAVSGEGFDRQLAELVIGRSESTPEWMESKGIRWQPAFRGTLHLNRTNRFFLGGGKALLNTYYRRAETDGVEVRYGTLVRRIRLQNGRFSSVELAAGDRVESIEAPALVVAAGGFESNLEWLGRYWGEAAANFCIRGTRHNDGLLLQELLALGAVARGNERGFHAVAVDARAPRYDGGIVTRIDSIPFGITVNREGRRFHDEGEDIWPKRYATWGRLIAEQSGQEAWSLFDSKTAGLFIPGVYPALSAGSVKELAAALGLDPEAVAATVAAFNSAVDSTRAFDPSRLDGRGTVGLAPAKSNWAQALDTPPYYAYPLRPGITFTYLAVGVDSRARVLLGGEAAIPNLFAAGEVMAGNVLLRGYLGGVGLTIGTVFGRIAGAEAAGYANAA